MKSKKLIFRWIGFLAVTLMTLSFAATSAHAQKASKPIVLKCSSNAPRDMTVMLGYEKWGKEIEKRSNGQVKCEFYWAQSLLKAVDSLKGTSAGIADVSVDVAAYHPTDTPFATVGELGYLTSKVDAPAKAMTDLYNEIPAFRDQFERHNVKVMFFEPFVPNIMGFTKQVRTLEDLKGMKIRALGLLNEVVAKLGGTPLAIPIPELYEAVSRGVIEGFTGLGINGIKGFKLHEVAKYYLDPGYGNYTTFTIIFNMDKWNSLPPNIRNIIQEVNDEAIEMFIDLYAKEDMRFVEPVIKAGCDFYTLPSDEVKRWKSRVVPDIWNSWVEKHKKYGPAQEIFDRYMELVKKYEPLSTYSNPFPK